MKKLYSEQSAVEEIIFPGECIQVTDSPLKTRKIHLDGGLQPTNYQRKKRKLDNVLLVTKVGKLEKTSRDRWSVCRGVSRYIPKRDDSVVGIITEARAYEAKVDIGAPKLAMMSLLAFEGATKRNKPILEVGDVLYCRVIRDCKDLCPELSCRHPYFKKDWVTGSNIFGQLKGGYVINVKLTFAAKLLEPNCFLLNELGKHFKYEVAIGANGRIWINSVSPRDIIIIKNAIVNAEGRTNNEVGQMIQNLVDRFRHQDVEMT